jgi:5-oxopent-3-ene-1,2,5-tricarboxylate decarboxylase/2-hydroxyhepta-2,4-diene-1,7-dioate isomerase
MVEGWARLYHRPKMAEQVPSPSKMIGVHIGYRSRAIERGKDPKVPSYFLKLPSTLAASGDPVVRPQGCELLAFEGEIALVIGKRARGVHPDDGWNHVGWVTAANDFGVYDLRAPDRGSGVRSKGSDGFTPLGPDLIAASLVDPGDLRVRTWVNDELVQEAKTSDDLIFPFGLIVADLSRLTTLEPGDIILTGTPTGSTVVEPGDEVVVEVDGGSQSSGRLRSPIVQSTEPLGDFGAMPSSNAALAASAYGKARPDRDPVEARYGSDTTARLRSVSTATLASQLNRRGLRGCILEGLTSSRPDAEMLGFARTVRYLPLREDLAPTRNAGLNAQKQAIEALGPGEVLVISAREESAAGTIGDILVARAMANGASGIITDGAIRDAAAISGFTIPTYHRAVSPAVLGHRHVPWDTDVAVACAGALVAPGDLLVGDADGVVVLPDALVAEIAADAEEQERRELFALQRVQDGSSINGLFPIGEVWQSRYERWCEEEGTE